MDVNDKREKRGKVSFEELEIGQVYEDEEGILCIKTGNTDNESNCICFVGDEWGVNFENSNARVTPLVATLEIER